MQLVSLKMRKAWVGRFDLEDNFEALELRMSEQGTFRGAGLGVRLTKGLRLGPGDKRLRGLPSGVRDKEG